MVAVPIPARPAVGTGWLGALIVLVGMRVFRVLGPRELDLLERAQIPDVTRILTLLGRRS